MCEPSAFWTVLEKVSVIGVLGLIVAPGPGLATAVAAPPAGNQLTAACRDFSQARGAAATNTVPAAAVRGSVTTLCGVASTWRLRWPAAP